MDVFEYKNELLLRCLVLDGLPLPSITLQLDGQVLIKKNNTNIVSSQVTVKDSAAIQCVVTIIGTNYTDSVNHQFFRAKARPLASLSESKYLNGESVFIVTILIFIIQRIAW